LFQSEQMQTSFAANANPYLYNGKEIQDMPGKWYDYGARFYDAGLGRWFVVDAMAEKREWVSPYNYCRNNPILRFDPNGLLDDGYKDMNGNYKWFDAEKGDIIGKEGKLWVKVTDNKNIFNMLEAGILDSDQGPSDPGQITEADNLTSFEMWLDSPSESVGETVGKIAAKVGYSIINSPAILLTGKSLGGTEAIPQEKMDAFIDVAPALISTALTKTGEVVKTTGKGLQGFNKFVNKVSGITTKKGLPIGMKWQQRAGKLFQTNKINQQSLKDLVKARNVLNVGNTTKNELEK